jgi:hypothetical protein
MSIVKEHINFERGQDPKTAMGIGLKTRIKNWLDDYEVTNYRILRDYTINTHDEVILNSKGLMELPDYIKFNEAYADFHINWNNLKNLKNCPKRVSGRFFANGNPLVSLEGIPKKIGGTISIARACGFTESDIKKVCDVPTVHLTVNPKELTFEQLQKIRSRYYP